MMRMHEIHAALVQLSLPTFVRSVGAVSQGFCKHENVGRDYHLSVALREREADPYKLGTWSPLSNHPFNFPADRDALLTQVTAAILMAVAHETIEQVGNGGQALCDPHAFRGGSKQDTAQWLALLDCLHLTVDGYSAMMRDACRLTS